MKELKVSIAFFFFLIFQPSFLHGQANWDSTYYDDYTSQITARFYFSQKYNSLLVDNEDSDLDLTYRPNTTFNMGIGASYDWFTLNLAYGFGFLNQDEERGETEYLDLQAHFYGQKVNIDLFGEFYDGYYLIPKGKGVTHESFYLRPDLKVTNLGANLQYIFNNEKYSFRASQLQNQRQKKSAGSFLLGAEFYFGIVRADSAIYPSLVAQDTLQNDQVDFFEFGPNVGYAYTLVFLKNFFLTASLGANIDYGVTTYYNNSGSDKETGVSPNAMVRAFAGWNTPKNAVSLVFINNKLDLTSHDRTRVSINTGNIRINYVHRFVPGPKTIKFLKPIRIFKKIEIDDQLMAAKKRIKSPYCTNCGKVLQEEDNFCPNCGQENDNKRQSFGHVMSHLVLDFLHFDSRIFKSLPALIFRPGFLTKEYLKGRRQNYLDPVKMFITIVVIYFLLSASGISKIVNQGNSIPADSVFALNEDVLDTTIQIGNVPMRIRTNEMDQPILWYDTTGSSNNKLSLDIPKFNEVKEMVKRGKTDTREILDSLQIENTFWNRFIYGESIKLIKSNFDGFADYMISKLPWIIFCIIPIFALLLKLLYVRRKFLYIDHLIFSFHLHSFVFVILILSKVVELWSMPSLATWMDIGMFIYIPFAFKNFYDQGWLKTLGKLILLFVMYIFAALFFFILALIIMFLMY